MTEYVVDEVVENPKLYAYIVISGLFNPDEVTAELGIAPTDVSRRGTQRGTSGTVFHKMDSWSFRVGPRETVEWPAMAEEILNVFEPKATELRALRERLEFESELLLVAYMSDQTPIGWFPPETVRRIADLGLALDIALYVMGDDDSEGPPT